MKITDVKYNWSGTLTKRSSTKYIILHHRAGNGDVQSIHRIHLSNGWSGIGYHFYVRKDGSIYTGRPIDTVGAHCTGFNSQSVGVCFEGDYEKESTMPQTQVSAGAELISYLMQLYPGAEIKAHRDFMATSCPGKNFPFEKIKSGVTVSVTDAENTESEFLLTTANDITWELSQMIQIDDVDGFVDALEKAKNEESPLYWGFYKIVNPGYNK